MGNFVHYRRDAARIFFAGAAYINAPLFGEMHINELAKTFHQKLTHRTNEEIIRISSGIPAYVVLLFRASILDRPTTLSNFENMQNIVQMQLNRLGEERDIAGYLACLKLCYDGMIPKAELMSLADVPELQLKSVFDAALAEELHYKQASIHLYERFGGKMLFGDNQSA